MEKIVLYIIFSICTSIVDTWCFFKIANLKITNFKKVTLALIIILIGASSLTGNISIAFLNLIEIFVFVLYTKKYGSLILLVGSITSICTADLLIDIISDMLSTNIIVGTTMRILLLSLLVYIVSRFHKQINHHLSDQNRKIFVGILVYIYISSISISTVYIQTNSFTPLTLFFSAYIIVQTFFAIFIYYEMAAVQKKLLSKDKQDKLKQQQKQLEEYASSLEKDEDDLRAFRHDYQNILNSLKISAQEGKVQEVVEKLDTYTKNNLNPKALLKYKDVNHIHIKSVKSIIITKLAEMYSLNIPYNFECRTDITKLPDYLNELDLVRIIGITIDNAIEESKSLIEEEHDIQRANINIMIYSAYPGGFEYRIRNKTRNQNIPTKQIQNPGFTTKIGHKGLGLDNVKQIASKYLDMVISYNISDAYFDFYMSIDEEDGEDDE